MIFMSIHRWLRHLRKDIELMYVNPFLAGVFATLFAEGVVLIVAAFIAGCRKDDRDGRG